MFSAINSSIMNYFHSCSRTFKDAGKYSRTAKCFSRIKDEASFIVNSRKVLGAQGRLATLVHVNSKKERKKIRHTQNKCIWQNFQYSTWRWKNFFQGSGKSGFFQGVAKRIFSTGTPTVVRLRFINSKLC